MMKTPKKAAPAKSAPVDEGLDDAVRNLVGLALYLRESGIYAALPDDLKKKKNDLHKLIKKCLLQKKEAVLAEALEQTHEEDNDAFTVLREILEELAENIVFRRDDGPDLEVNAFVIPLFVRTRGGLRSEQCFQDEAAFDLLRESIQAGELESRKAQVVLVSHAYHPEEIDRIGYSRLSEMVREAHETMTRKKTVAAPAIEASMSGWPASGFGAEDAAVELRFLLGFTLKALNDPFYQVPAKEAAADRYFEARAERFRQWAERARPLLGRCLVTDGRSIDIDFLYQDLFYSGTRTGFSEYAMLQLLSELHQALDASGTAPGSTHAIVGPAENEVGTVLRVQLYAGVEGAMIAAADKELIIASDPRSETEDILDALASMEIGSVAVAMRFDDDGTALGVRQVQSA